MIKFFRQIRYNLMQTGKTGKYFKYAIGEILLVVIGILIALQINNWNEGRKTQSQEQVILEVLHTDFNHNLNAFNTAVSVHRRTLNACDIIIRNMKSTMKYTRLPIIWSRVLVIPTFVNMSWNFIFLLNSTIPQTRRILTVTPLKILAPSQPTMRTTIAPSKFGRYPPIFSKML